MCSPDDHNPEKHFPKGKELYFFSFKSASTDPAVLSSEQFCGHDKTKPRTVFEIQASEAYIIAAFSEFGASEAEVMFAPLSKFTVLHAAKKCDPTLRLDATGGFPDTVVLKQEAGELRVGGGVANAIGRALGVAGVNVPAPKVYETILKMHESKSNI